MYLCYRRAAGKGRSSIPLYATHFHSILRQGNLKKVAFIVKEANLEQQPLERFIFDFAWLIPANDISGSNGQDFRFDRLPSSRRLLAHPSLWIIDQRRVD